MRGIRLTALALLLVSAVLAEDAPFRPPQGVPPFQTPEPPFAGGAAPSVPFAPMEPIDPPTPMVAIRVRVPASIRTGTDITYQITVENTSRAAAHQVVVRNPLPKNAEFVSAKPEPTEKPPQLRWLLGTLQPREKREITLVLKPTGPGEVTNIARVAFEHGQAVKTVVGDAPAGPPESAPVPRAVPSGQAALQIRTRGPVESMVEQGTVVTYTVEVSNIGTGTAKDVSLSSNLSDGLRFVNSTPSTRGEPPYVWKLGDIPAGKIRPVELTLTTRELGAQAVTFKAADATGAKHEDTSSFNVGMAKLDILVTGPTTRFINVPAQYTITVENTGTMTATNAIVRSEVVQEMTLVRDRTSRGFFLAEPQQRGDGGSYREIRWSLGNVKAGEKKTLEFSLQTDQALGLTQTAWVEADRGVTARHRCLTTFTAGGTALRVESIDKKPDPVEVGKTCEYTIVVRNEKGADPAKDVTLTIELTEHLRFDEMSVVKAPVAVASATTNTIGFRSLPAPLAAGEAATFVIKVQAVKAGSALVTTKLSGGAMTSPLTNSESTTVREK